MAGFMVRSQLRKQRQISEKKPIEWQRELGPVQYGDERIRFVVRRQPERKLNRIAIHVEPDGRVMVDAPSSASSDRVLSAFKMRSRWISQQVAVLHARLAHGLPREYVSGESAFYLGRRSKLKVRIVSGEPADCRMRGDHVVVSVPERSPTRVHAQLDDWFRMRAREVFQQRLKAIAASRRWVRQLPPTRLQNMRVQWGSCSPAGRITPNPHLVKAPRECIDYVMLHELCHLRHHNHGPHFYQALDGHMPRWRAIKGRLDGMAEQILPPLPRQRESK